MRERFNLDLVTLDKVTLLIHGAYGAGKTHLLGDFLSWATKQGNVRYLNIKGEDGATSLAHAGLGNVGETVSTLGEYQEARRDYAKEKLIGLGVDSLPALYDLVLLDLLGEVRLPDAKKDGDRGRFFWGQAGVVTKDSVTRSRSAAPYVMWVSAFDKSEDAVVGGTKSITPNLPGKLAHAIAGSFDFVGYLTAEILAGGKVERKVSFAPSSAVLTRQRIPRPILAPVSIPSGGGGWGAIFGAMQAALTPEGKK